MVIFQDNGRKTLNDYIDCFKSPDLAEAWARVMNEKVRPFVVPLTNGRKNGGKMLWGLVIDQSQVLGILKKSLMHQTAAELLAVVCPGCFDDVGALKTSLDNSYKAKNLESMGKLEMDLGPQIREFLKTVIPVPNNTLSVESPLHEHAYAIAEKIVDNQYNRNNCIVRKFPEYEVAPFHRIAPAVSIETYPDEKAIANNEPSSVVSFECCDNGISDSRIKMYHGEYSHFGGRHHLIIITRAGFMSEQAEQLCKAYHMGMWIVRSDGTYDRILSRSVNELAALQSAREALYGGVSQNRDIVYFGGEFMTLPELLSEYGVRIKPGYILKAPYYSKDEIKDIASEHLRLIGYKGYGFTVQGIERLSDEFGFTWGWGPLMEHQLGICNFDENRITISNTLQNDPHRFRFVFGHDGGHYVLQKDCVGQLINAFGESEETLLTCSFPRKELLWLEWQANQYARYLLMPDEIMKNLINKCFDKRMIRMHRLYVDDHPWNLSSYYAVMHQMSRLANVSMEALRYRLIEMKWLVDERKSQRIGSLFNINH